MKIITLICLTIAYNLTAIDFANASVRSVKSEIRSALDYCDERRSRIVVECMQDEIKYIKEAQYQKASSRNNNRLICKIDTEYYDDDGDGWGWIPETRESCVVIGQKNTSRRASQLDNSLDVYNSLKWLKKLNSCFGSNFSSFDFEEDRSHRRVRKNKGRHGDNKKRSKRKERNQYDRQIECLEDKSEYRW